MDKSEALRLQQSLDSISLKYFYMAFYKPFLSHRIVCQLYFLSTRSGISLKVKAIIYKEMTLSTHSISFISSVLEILDGFKIVFPHLASVICQFMS